MIKALVQNRHGVTSVVEMPCDGYALSSELWMSDIQCPPSRLKISDDNEGGVAVTLKAEDHTGEQLISIFSPPKLAV